MNERKDIEPDEGGAIARGLAERWLHEPELIPIRHLSLDVDEPVNGWEQTLLERGVEVVEDDLGRPCVRREVLGDLLREERESLARIEAEGAARAAAAVAPVAVGVPAQEGASPFASMMSAESSHYETPWVEFGGRERPNFLQEELEAGARQLAAAQAEAAKKGKDR